MKTGIATHKKSGTQVEFMHYTKGNYRETLEWYEQDVKDGYKAVYGRDGIIAGDGFSYYTQEGKRKLIDTDWYLVKWGQSDYVASCPRDFKEWYEVIEVCNHEQVN